MPVSAEALSARRSWMASTPTRAGAWSAGIVGALLATGVVLIGGHLTHLLSTPTTSKPRLTISKNLIGSGDPESETTLLATTTTSPGGDADLYSLAARVAPAMPMVFVDHKPSGTGIVISSKGYVLVPSSLITDPDDIGLSIAGQGLLPATLVGVDPNTGLAVVRVHAMSALPALSFTSGGDVGLGSFFALVWVDSLGTHVCWGSVSSLDVKLSSSEFGPPLLETLETMSTPPVATGGVIVDGAGRLMGIVTGSAGKSLVAAPGWLAGVVSGDIIRQGRVVHGWLGITGETVQLSPTETAVRVVTVTRGGSAAKAGVKPGDIIEDMNGDPTRTMEDVMATLYAMRPNVTVTLELDRHGRVFDARALLRSAA